MTSEKLPPLVTPPPASKGEIRISFELDSRGFFIPNGIRLTQHGTPVDGYALVNLLLAAGTTVIQDLQARAAGLINSNSKGGASHGNEEKS